MLCLCAACLMRLYAMLCGLSGKSQCNPGAWVLNLAILIIYFLTSHHLFFFFFFFHIFWWAKSIFKIFFIKKNINKFCAFQMTHLSRLLQACWNSLTDFRNAARKVPLMQRKNVIEFLWVFTYLRSHTAEHTYAGSVSQCY